MASNTPKLNLLKKNPVTEGTDTFNIKTMLNDNWDKIDQFAIALEDQLKVEGAENIATAVAALIREVGSLPSLTTETKTSLVAAINEVSKKLTEHSEVDASISKAGHVQLEDSIDSTSTTKAATANAVNKVKKLISNVSNFAIATVAEAKAGVVNNKYMTPLRVSDAIAELAPGVIPGESIIANHSAIPGVPHSVADNNIYKELAKYSITKSGTYRLKYTVGGYTSAVLTTFRTFINDVEFGPERNISTGNTLSFIEDIPLRKNDTLSIKGKITHSSNLSTGLRFSGSSIGVDEGAIAL